MSTQKIVIGLTGGPGSGKGEVVNFLTTTGFVHFSARKDVLLPKVHQYKLEPNRTNLNTVSNDLRKKYGPEYVAYLLFSKACRGPHNAVVESIYTVGEIEAIREGAECKGIRFVLVSVDAPVEVRYKRIQARASETDHVSFEQFCLEEQREQTSSDPSKHNLFACRERADIKIINNFLDLQSFHNHLRKRFQVAGLIT
ncbi:MAG: dephospho-CoA kinase [Parcubacteria bacterium C7867-003]|nr:MAG: dephospho-CoA kinase [Parcubacteria bacterium C7867-003]